MLIVIRLTLQHTLVELYTKQYLAGIDRSRLASQFLRTSLADEVLPVRPQAGNELAVCLVIVGAEIFVCYLWAHLGKEKEQKEHRH